VTALAPGSVQLAPQRPPQRPPHRALERRRIRVVGVVQGVGFRPFVVRLATELGLAGHVGNDPEGVFIEVEGGVGDLEVFAARLTRDAPPLAHVFGVESAVAEVRHERGFRVVESVPGGAVGTFVSPDVAVCTDCLGELFDPSDRRWRYPFINCTNCGPRFTITLRLPYDRSHTTMAGFELCPACRSEYGDPADRRFHAQPVACPDCGPRLWFEGGGWTAEGTDDALAATQAALAAGAVVAIKGLGGYHLACDARSSQAVATLRRRKERPDKPLAVMVRDLSVARRLAHIGPAEAALLTGSVRPIVLLNRLSNGSPPPALTPAVALALALALADEVAPENPYLGVMLPYTPLHHLLFETVPGFGSEAPVPDVLVMTSGNLSDEPICHDDTDARRRLGRIADAWLLHNRPIHVPCDDSVVRVEDGEERPIRRSRGYAPLPVHLPFEMAPTLAMGGELKNTFCLASGHDAFMSQHIGDMGSLETLAAFERSTGQFEDMYRVDPQRVAADAHPGYQTRRWADERSGRPVELVQHHHAHIAAVMAEHAVPAGERVIGFAFDGTGYGTDGAIWGGEVLIAGYDGFERAAHLRYVPLPGGDATIRKPYRAALAHLWAAGLAWDADLAPVRHATAAEECAVLERQLEHNVQCVPTSSMGRLFDAASSLIGLRHVASYEAQAAIELEWMAAPHVGAARDYAFEFDLVGEGDRDGDGKGGELLVAPLWRGMIDDLRQGVPTGAIAAGFHLAVARMIAGTADRLRTETGLTRVALSGGVFQNALLVQLTRAELAARQLQVLTHRVVPTNDGGLALGQAVVAGYRGNRSAGGCGPSSSERSGPSSRERAGT
jgi:hydrogenase maturation protein HypF